MAVTYPTHGGNGWSALSSSIANLALVLNDRYQKDATLRTRTALAKFEGDFRTEFATARQSADVSQPGFADRWKQRFDEGLEEVRLGLDPEDDDRYLRDAWGGLSEGIEDVRQNIALSASVAEIEEQRRLAVQQVSIDIPDSLGGLVRLGDMNPAEAEGRVVAAAEDADLPGSVAIPAIAEARQRLYGEHYRGLIDRSPEEAVGMLELPEAAEFLGLETRNTLLGKARTALDGRQRRAARNVGEVIKHLEGGNIPNPDLLDEARAFAATYPVTDELDLARDLVVAEAIGARLQAIKAMPVSGFQEVYDGHPAGEPTTPDEARAMRLERALMENEMIERREDPLGHALRIGVYELPDLDAENLGESLAARSAIADEITIWAGTRAGVLTKAEADALRRSVDEGGAQAQMEMLEEIAGADVPRETLSATWQMLGEEDEPLLNSAIALIDAGESERVDRILGGKDFLTVAGAGLPGQEYKEAKNEALFALGGSAADPGMYGSLSKAVDAAYAFHAQEEGEDMKVFNEDIFELSVRDALGSVGEVNDHPTVIPVGWDDDMVEDFIGNITLDRLRAVAIEGSGDPMIYSQFAEQWEPLDIEATRDEWKLVPAGVNGEYTIVYPVPGGGFGEVKSSSDLSRKFSFALPARWDGEWSDFIDRMIEEQAGEPPRERPKEHAGMGAFRSSGMHARSVPLPVMKPEVPGEEPPLPVMKPEVPGEEPPLPVMKPEVPGEEPPLPVMKPEVDVPALVAKPEASALPPLRVPKGVPYKPGKWRDTISQVEVPEGAGFTRLEWQSLVAQVARHEGFEPQVYDDSAGDETVPTIGFGTNTDVGGRGYLKDRTLSVEEALELLEGALAESVAELRRSSAVVAAPERVPRRPLVGDVYERQPPGVRMALSNMAYNMGLTRLLGFEKMWVALGYGDYEAAAREALDSKWAREQVGRRAPEIADIIRKGE